MPIKIDEAECMGCAPCAEACPANAITVEEQAKVATEACTERGACVDKCPAEVVTLEEKS
jgi:NAD-dependent dihydropyrimidine dehydrogenase PreA subunit